METEARVVEADLRRAEHQRDVLKMTDLYARDPMGNAGPLPIQVMERIIIGLREHPTTMVFLAYVDHEAAGIATCFRGFSTFTARPLVNIHDFAVAPTHRGRGVGRALLEAVERKARELGCSRITLEVQEHNRRARSVYASAGFAQNDHGDGVGGALFYVKHLVR